MNFYHQMIETVLRAILDRFEADPAYPFIDTKLDLITGADFDDCADPHLAYRRKEYIYSWIQGRGLEAMAGHAVFLPEYRPRLLPLLEKVSSAMERLRGRAGRLWFVMTRDGQPLRIENFHQPEPLETLPDCANFSELFYAKGLFAAAIELEDSRLTGLAAARFRAVLDDIAGNRFRTDQQAFDPRNPVAHIPGRMLQGPRMIALGGLSLMMNSGNTDCDWQEYAGNFIEYILDKHVRQPGFGFMEAIAGGGLPYCIGGQILGDPGHAGEFVGLAAKCLRNREFRERYPELAKRAKRELPEILRKNFELGYNPKAHGICKSVDLLTGRRLNADMPWWNLPETMRAAFFTGCPDILEKCSDSFRRFFINEKVHMMAYQTRNAAGEVVRVVPATPDADPGYHTNLSLIDILSGQE